MSRKLNKGLTLVELLLAVFILSTSIVGSLMFFSSAMISAELAREMTVATSHAETILEEMQTFDSLSKIKNANWVKWGYEKGLNTLPKETFQVIIAKPAKDLLDIDVTVHWTTRLRTNNISLKTQITR